MKGIFKPSKPEKYRGDSRNICYRSSFELKYMRYLEQSDDVLEWASEEISIPYISPKDGKVHRYFPDFWVRTRNKGEWIIEVKPLKETMTPQAPKKPGKRFLKEVMTFGVNSAKWEAAKEFCNKNNMKFALVTEKELKIRK